MSSFAIVEDVMLADAIWMLFVLAACYSLINASIMLWSPTAWSALPRWLKVAGIPEREIPPRWLGWYVRAVAVLILIAVAWMMYGFSQMR
jgi:hypothetical protein